MNSGIISPRAAALTPYTPGEQPRHMKFIKLNTNENPYPPCPGVQRLLQRYSHESLRLYPDPTFSELRHSIAGRFSLSADEVFAGNGSDEILSFAFYAFFDPERGPVLFPEHTYSFYPVYCGFYNLSYRKIPLRHDFSIDLDRYLKVNGHAGTVIANPNAPTGMALPRNEIEKFLDQYPSDHICIIDEAYVDFGTESCAGLVRDYPNLLVVHTLSKSRSLAGLRVGYALGNPELIRTLFTVKDSFNSYPVNRLSQDIAVESFLDDRYFEDTRHKIIATRETTTARLTALGWQVLPSLSNFVFARLPGIHGSVLYERLKEKGILVRHFTHPGIDDFIRITIGTDEEMEVLHTTLLSLDFVRR